jgi:hypothetical protein
VFHFLLLTMFCHINHMLRNLVVTQSVRRHGVSCVFRPGGQAADHAFSSRDWNALRPAGPRGWRSLEGIAEAEGAVSSRQSACSTLWAPSR